LIGRQKPFRFETLRVLARIVLLFVAILGVFEWEWQDGINDNGHGRTLFATIDNHIVKVKIEIREIGHYRVHRVQPTRLKLLPNRDSDHTFTDEEFSFTPCYFEFTDKPFTINILTDDPQLAGEREIHFLSRDNLRSHGILNLNREDFRWAPDGKEFMFNGPFDKDWMMGNEALGISPDKYWTPFPLNQYIYENVIYSVKSTLIAGWPTILIAVIVAMVLTSQKLWILVTRIAIDPGCCPECGYDLAGLEQEAGCPECGWGRMEIKEKVVDNA